MNFNFSQQPEYKLNASLINEVIDHFGIQIKFIITEKINSDKTVFGDFSHIKTNKENVFELYALPETSESFDISSYNFSEFGFISAENITLFVFAENLDKIIEMKKVVGNLIVLPNNKVLEITNIDFMVQGINNLFVFNDAKSVYRLTCVPYEFKLTDEVDDTHLINEVKIKDDDKEIIGYEETPLYNQLKEVSIPSADDKELEQINRENYKALDDYINTLIKEKDDQDYEAEVLPYAETVDDENTDSEDKVENKAVYSKEETDVWNGY